MNAKELKAAAERLVQSSPPDAVHEGIYADMDEMASDACEVASAYLARLAADEAERSELPAWHDKPTGPGLWLCQWRSDMARGFPPTLRCLDADDMAVIWAGPCFGPIPPRPTDSA